MESYIAFEGAHMRREERELVPPAESHLTTDDWALIDAAFEGHTDPLPGGEPGKHWELLFQWIVRITPPPISVGPPRHST